MPSSRPILPACSTASAGLPLPRANATGSQSAASLSLAKLVPRVQRGIVDDRVEQGVERAAELRSLPIAELDQVPAVDGEILESMRLGALLLEQLAEALDRTFAVRALLAGQVRLLVRDEV